MGHDDGSPMVHLTSRSFFVEALCGAVIELEGEPALAAICDECDRLGWESGGDPESWVTIVDAVTLLRAAA